MNLMFWKKNNADGADSHESEIPVARGVFERIKSAITARMPHLKKPAAFGADGDNDRPAEATRDSQTVPCDVPGNAQAANTAEETPKAQGLLARIRSGFAVWGSRFRKTPEPIAEEDKPTDTDIPHSPKPGSESSTCEAADKQPGRSKKRLIVGSVIGLFLLLAILGLAAWKFFSPPSVQDTAEHDTDSPSQTAHIQPEKPQTKTGDDDKKSGELQTHADTAKKELPQPQETISLPEQQSKKSDLQTSGSGEITVGNNDPKATAISLKEAIEAMNAGTGTPARKSTK